MTIRHTPLAALLSMALFTSANAERLLEPIVVTASRFESAKQDQPIATQVITADDIRDSTATNVSEVLNKLGGVYTRINFTGLPDSPLDLRGFGMTGDQNTLVLLNGQRLSDFEGGTARLSSIPIESIERIEILRGSGAVQYGSGATAGTINIITKSPIGSPLGGYLFGQAGSHNSRDARGGIQVGGEHWGMRLDAQHYESDNYRDNNRAKTDNVSGELRFGNQKDYVALSFTADNQKTRLPGARTEAELKTDRRGTRNPDDYLNSRGHLYALRAEKNLGAVTLALDASYRDKTETSFYQDLWGSRSRKTDGHVVTVSPRLLLKNKWGDTENTFTVGADWSEWTFDSSMQATGFYSTLDERGRQENKAVYARNEINFPTGTRLSLGLRREFIEQHQRQWTPFVADRSTTARLTAHEIALQQALGLGFSAYARTGRSFRVANINENYCSFAPCAEMLKPQTSHDHEIGLEWKHRIAALRVSLFRMDVNNEIHYNNLTWSTMNLSPTRHQGLELEGRIQVLKNVDVAARYTRTQATFREGTYGGVNVTGNDVPMVPKDRIGLNVGWQITGSTRASLNVQYVGGQRYDNDQANRFRKMPSYTVTDLKIMHEIGNWRLAAGVNNLFDEKYYSYGIVNGSYSSFNAYPETRRTVYASAEYRF